MSVEEFEKRMTELQIKLSADAEAHLVKLMSTQRVTVLPIEWASIDDLTYDSDDEVTSPIAIPVCECGSTRTGLPTHSTWCPVA